MKEIDWEERHFQICLAILSCPECNTHGHPDAPSLSRAITKADKMVELLKKRLEKVEKDCSHAMKLIRKEYLGKYGYTDERGEWVINPKFDFLEEFADGLAAASLGDGVGYIDSTGEFIIEPRFAEAYNFDHGVAFASEEYGMRGLIDKMGTWLHEPMFKMVYNFDKDGFAEVQIHPDRCYGDDACFNWIDRNGKLYNKKPK